MICVLDELSKNECVAVAEAKSLGRAYVVWNQGGLSLKAEPAPVLQTINIVRLTAGGALQWTCRSASDIALQLWTLPSEQDDETNYKEARGEAK